jgi:type I restriction enzyme R subunit
VAALCETWLDKPSDGIVDKTRKIHDDYIHDFVFDDGRIQNIYLLDKKEHRPQQGAGDQAV